VTRPAADTVVEGTSTTAPEAFETQEPGPDPNAEDEAWRALDPPPPLPVLCCDVPAFGTWPLVSDQLRISGWAMSQSESSEMVVEIDVSGVGVFQAHYGLRRPDIADQRSAPIACGWRRLLTTSDWEAGLYDVTVTARDGLGNETTLRRRVRVDPRAAYTQWLENRDSGLQDTYAARRFADTDPTAPRFLVVVLNGTRATIGPQHYSLFDVAPSPDVDQAIRMVLDGAADYGVLVTGDVILEPHALHALAIEAVSESRPHIIYSDHDLLAADGGRHRPFFKPGWSPELLLSMDYVGPFVCLSKEAGRRALDVDGTPIASIYDLLLRLVDEDLTVVRIPDVLWTRTSESHRDKERGRELVLRVAERRGMEAAVFPLPYSGARVVHWEPVGEPRVSIIIATAFTNELVIRCVESIRERTTYANYEIVLVANGLNGREPPAVPGNEVQVVTYDAEFNYSAVNNAGARAASGDYLLFLNDDTVVVTPEWIERMLGEAQQPGVGIVGAKLLYPGGLAQLMGHVLVDNEAGAAWMSSGIAADDPGYRGIFACVRNMSSVCGACMLVRRALFEELGGFDEALHIELNDVDLGLRALQTGSRIAFTPNAVLIHDERASRGGDMHPRDHGRFKHRWARLIEDTDPYYNPNLGYNPEYEIDRGPVAVPPDKTHVWSERYIPKTMAGLIQAEHEARYLWAMSAVPAKEVLDAGCGVGYGSLLLARAGARRVVGIDASAEAIEDARFRAGSCAEFVEGDIEDLPFAARSFDVVVCFETIEHVDDGGRALAEFKRVLRPDGVLIISSPNRGVSPPGNPHHVHEYTAAELRAALSARFHNVALHRQHPWGSTLITDDLGLKVRDVETDTAATVRKVTPLKPGRETYTLALASDADLPELHGVAVLTGLNEAEHWHSVSKAWESFGHAVKRQLDDVREQLRVLEEHVAAADAAASALEAGNAELQRDLAELQRQPAELERALAGMRESWSWRVTAPLRAAHQLIHRGS
jgi:GT2 family glycosyltransferase/protein-L-isoaspartate O-methyltransferase